MSFGEEKGKHLAKTGWSHGGFYWLLGNASYLGTQLDIIFTLLGG